MSFIGAIPADVRTVLAGYTAHIKHPVLNICAGNFTIPSVLRSAGYKGEIKTCDITLYTSALGAYLTGRKLDLSTQPDCPEHLKDLVSIDTPIDTIASIALLYDLRQVWKMKNPFQKRQVEIYRANWPQLMDKTKAKLQAYKKHLGKIQYEAKDGFKVLEDADPAHTFICAPPIYKGDYENLDKLLRTAIAWQSPEYTPILDDDLSLYRLIKKFNEYIVILYKDLPEVHAIIGTPRAIIMPRGRGSNTLYLISQKSKPAAVVRHKVKSEDIGPFFPADRQFTGREKLDLTKISVPQSIRMNELFASAMINTFTGGVAESLAFLADGYIIGKADFCATSHQWKLPGEQDPAMIYLMSDLVVPNCTEKIAKLILLALLSRDVKEVLDLRFAEDFKYVLTTCFTRHPSSMKYRGLFKMHKRIQDPDKYRINYYAPFSAAGLKTAGKRWAKKYKKEI